MSNIPKTVGAPGRPVTIKQDAGVPDYETKRQTANRLDRLARDVESLREIRAILEKIYGKGSLAR